MICIPQQREQKYREYVPDDVYKGKSKCKWIVGLKDKRELIIAYQFKRIWFIVYTQHCYGPTCRSSKYVSPILINRIKGHVTAGAAFNAINQQIFEVLDEAGF